MKITQCELNELSGLYTKAGQDALFAGIRFTSEQLEGMTYRVRDGEDELFVTIIFLPSPINPLGRYMDLIVTGFATRSDVEQISPLLEQFLIHILRDNPHIEFNIVSFPCLTMQQEDPQLFPYLDQSKPGCHPPISVVDLPEFHGYIRVRLAHDAQAFRDMHSE